MHAELRGSIFAFELSVARRRASNRLLESPRPGRNAAMLTPLLSLPWTEILGFAIGAVMRGLLSNGAASRRRVASDRGRVVVVVVMAPSTAAGTGSPRCSRFTTEGREITA
jgi:hypothetical protein